MQISQSNGGNRHNNFWFKQAKIQEIAVIMDIRDLTAQLRDVTIVETVEKKVSRLLSLLFYELYTWLRQPIFVF